MPRDGTYQEQIKEYTNSQMAYVISEYIHHERNRKILYRHFIDGITFEDLEKEFCLSTRRIKAIVAKEERVIWSHI